jgi:hypothetical protein
MFFLDRLPGGSKNVVIREGMEGDRVLLFNPGGEP